MHAYERWIARHYLIMAVKNSYQFGKDLPASDFRRWVQRTHKALGLPVPWVEDEIIKSHSSDFTIKLNEKSWNEWRKSVTAMINGPAPAKCSLQKKVDWLSDACKLDEKQLSILTFYVWISNSTVIRDLVIMLNCCPIRQDRFDFDEARSFLDPEIRRYHLEKGQLSQYGFIQADNFCNYELSNIINDLFSENRPTQRVLTSLLFGDPLVASLTWNDYDHLGDIRNLIWRMIKKSSTHKSKGINILLYGSPGTGKSEFVKTLAVKCGMSARFIGEGSKKNEEPTRKERIASLIVANAFGAATNNMIVAVDEADDLFAGVDEDNAATRHGSKVFMHRLVEEVKSPTVWIINDINRLGDSVIRRMNLVIRFSQPRKSVRLNIVNRIANKTQFQLEQEEVERIANYPASPALIENAIHSTILIDGSVDDTCKIIETGMEALGIRIPRASKTIKFDPTISSADCNLSYLAASVRNASKKSLSFCFSGPSGTGKSAYARYLAENLEMEVLDKRYSDLVSAYVGESEKAIARAFEEAADTKSFLIFDEADSLLLNRSNAQHAWQITQVNEMLISMEKHSYPFVCTTNAGHLIDPATARRFLFKVNFVPMTSLQAVRAFQEKFGAPPPEFVSKLEGLTPGDFSVVSEKAEALGQFDPLQLAIWLQQEANTKPEMNKRRIGF